MAVAWAIPSMTGWAAWTGFAVVGALVLAIALALAMMARSRFKGARHMPLTVETMKENVQWTRARKL
jgi:hypothetical protein